MLSLCRLIPVTSKFDSLGSLLWDHAFWACVRKTGQGHARDFESLNLEPGASWMGRLCVFYVIEKCIVLPSSMQNSDPVILQEAGKSVLKKSGYV